VQAAALAPERPVSLEESAKEIEAETVALKPPSREEQARVSPSCCPFGLSRSQKPYLTPCNLPPSNPTQDWFNAVISARSPDPLFAAASEAGLGRLLDGETKAPTRKEEAWRFTDLGKLYGKRPAQAPQVLQKEQAAAVAAKVEEHSLDVCAGRVMVSACVRLGLCVCIDRPH
jgi:hypothetical protein